MAKTVAILDYGISNLFNIARMVELAGANARITTRREDVEAADGLILPGVGAFAEAMRQMEQTGLIHVIPDLARKGHPVLGICLGMQLFLSSSEEGRHARGFGMVEGSVVRLSQRPGPSMVKVPHMGWAKVNMVASDQEGQRPTGMLSNWMPESYMYFLHSYYPVLADLSAGRAVTQYGDERFYSVIQRDGFVGCQFHPERSGRQGFAFLKAFVGTL